MKEFVITKELAGGRMDKYLHKILPNASTSFLYKMLRKKNITLNSKKAEGKELLKEGDSIKVFFSEETMALMEGSGSLATSNKTSTDLRSDWCSCYERFRSKISVLYEDEDILLADKPAGLLVQRANPKDDSMNEVLLGYLVATEFITEESLRTFKPSICNRLDRNTSGIVLFGKTYRGARLLNALLNDRTLAKYYRCIVRGRFEKEMHSALYLKKDSVTNQVTISETEKSGYTRIETGIRPIAFKNHKTLLEIHLITGKTHQIRAHLAYLGFPLVGDVKYGTANEGKKKSENGDRFGQLLHAYRVVFPTAEQNPIMKEFPSLAGAQFICPCPKEICLEE